MRYAVFDASPFASGLRASFASGFRGRFATPHASALPSSVGLGLVGHDDFGKLLATETLVTLLDLVDARCKKNVDQ